jgi:hypothetical protein
MILQNKEQKPITERDKRIVDLEKREWINQRRNIMK